ncbi:HAMP domain-containing histidine kinase [Nocardioides sp. cx-169]|uniref:sensor histidine kinase n=1 Tax=Nocardioides sp. cx-169 TaxID=2899080 RepID=UPI001E4954F3|nr:HAMP domain-containing sensor histidine kinase [Nocardioides sp. cx-169]MCD4534558.1 HAMP domain-containing histidine kinase [Nocardioides sp. cx-169]
MAVREIGTGRGDLTSPSTAPDAFARPAVSQSLCALLFALDLGLRFLGDVDSGPWPRVGAGLLVVVTLAAFVLPWDRLPAASPAALAVADLLVIGLFRLDAQGGGSAVLMVLPGLYLGRYFGRRGVVVTAVAAVLLVGVPNFLYFGLDGPNVSRMVLSVLVAVVAAMAMALAVSRLQHERRVSAAILDSVDVGLVLLDAEGAYQAYNRRHGDFMRLAYPEGHAGMAGQLGLVYDADGSTEVPTQDMPSTLASMGEEFDDLRIWVGDDPVSRRALSVSARAVRDASGDLAGAALAYTDVTELMRALTVKDEFISLVSHELRTPLTSIHGYAMLLLERHDLDPQVRSQLEVVVRNTERLQRLVEDLLHTGQIDDEAMYFRRVECDLVQIVRQAVQAAEPHARDRGVTLGLRTPQRLMLRVDPQRIAQVLDNLLSNAIKYTEPGGRVTVALGTDVNRVEIAVTDTGVGIDAADRDRLFTRFFRSQHAEEQSIQGVGLGLSIARSIVEGHGGRIDVDSEIGRGSTFRVRLPLS